jgi:hypothetical protein
MNILKNERGSHVIAVVLAIVVLGVIGFAVFTVYKKSQPKSAEAGLASWKNNCSGTGTVTMKNSPMNLNEVSSIMPLGLLAGAHVTPIDHLYFYPKDMQHRDAAPVYAMADGYIVDFSERTANVDTGTAKQGEYRIVMQHTCSFYSYFDLLTSMNGDLLKKLQAGDRHVQVKAGQEIGRVGAQSLDTAIYNLDLKLPGFINPESYKAEPWKIHTDNFFTYFKEPLLAKMLALNPRKVEPYSGKIDYDIAGKLRGNWFKQGTNGYAGPKEFSNGANGHDGKGYWSGHFSIAPDAIDPAKLDISFGNYQGKAMQFTAVNPLPDPAEVDASSGPVKYELAEYKIQGGFQNANQPQPTNTATGMTAVKGTVLLQVQTGGNTLKIESFPGKTATQVSGFTSAAQLYER